MHADISVDPNPSEVLPPANPEKIAKSKNRKAEVELHVKLTEEEIKVKYQDNEEYHEWSRRLSRFKADLERGIKKGLPKIFYLEDDARAITEDHQRWSNLREVIGEKI